MGKSIGLLLLQMLGLKDFKTDTCRQLLGRAIKDNEDTTKELAELIGVSEDVAQDVIKGLREIVTHEAKKTRFECWCNV